MLQTWENSLPHSGKNKCHFSGKVLAVYKVLNNYNLTTVWRKKRALA
jgi:hypothetical protein